MLHSSLLPGSLPLLAGQRAMYDICAAVIVRLALCMRC